MNAGSVAWPGGCPDEVAAAHRVSVPFAPQSAIAARAAITTWLHGIEASPGVIDDVRLVVSELVGNALRHGAELSGPGEQMLEVSWLVREGALVVCVADGGAGLSEQVVPAVVPADATGGRGLGIVDALSTRWWTRSSGGVHAVHAQIPLR